jgi:hypothetical protein
MTGNILGTLLGKDAIPVRWLGKLELRDEIEELAADLFRHFGDPDAEGQREADLATSLAPQFGVGDARVSQETDWEKYPGW